MKIVDIEEQDRCLVFTPSEDELEPGESLKYRYSSDEGIREFGPENIFPEEWEAIWPKLTPEEKELRSYDGSD